MPGSSFLEAGGFFLQTSRSWRLVAGFVTICPDERRDSLDLHVAQCLIWSQGFQGAGALSLSRCMARYWAYVRSRVTAIFVPARSAVSYLGSGIPESQGCYP